MTDKVEPAPPPGVAVTQFENDDADDSNTIIATDVDGVKAGVPVGGDTVSVHWLPDEGQAATDGVIAEVVGNYTNSDEIDVQLPNGIILRNLPAKRDGVSPYYVR